VSAEAKKKYLKSLFQSLKDEQIEAALDACDWDKMKAAQHLSDQLREKRSSPVVIKKVPNTLLERSLLLGQKLDQDVIASHLQFEKALKEEVDSRFKKDLEHIMKVQARHGVSPGMAPPPLPKQIDAMLGKNKAQPIDDADLVAPQPPSQSPDSPPSDLPSSKLPEKGQDNLGRQVKLSAPDVVDVGNNIVVSWEMIEGESSNYDWIGLFPVDQPNKQYISYQWIPKTDTHKGSITFVAPNTYGSFEFRYFVNKSYNHVAMSNRVTIGPKVELEAKLDSNKVVVKWTQQSGNKYPRAWIGFYEKAQTNNKLYITWEYASVPQVSFAAPVKPNSYEARFFTNSYEDVARSNAVRIEGEDKLAASIQDGVITVTPHIVSVDPYYDAVWLGIFFTHEADNRQWRRYKYITERDTEVKFKAPNTPGEYEVRLFACKSYDSIVKSNSFKIEKKQQ